MQPDPPQPQSSAMVASGMWPISPAMPVDPRQIDPLIIRSDPAPVPSGTNATDARLRPAPIDSSANPPR